jgi:hypothetical protein
VHGRKYSPLPQPRCVAVATATDIPAHIGARGATVDHPVNIAYDQERE